MVLPLLYRRVGVVVRRAGPGDTDLAAIPGGADGPARSPPDGSGARSGTVSADRTAAAGSGAPSEPMGAGAPFASPGVGVLVASPGVSVLVASTTGSECIEGSDPAARW
ncbi:hypothetical protein GCM10029978_026250 [Actinoallomurus acanthiterrae]